jgi:hypothetical protein
LWLRSKLIDFISRPEQKLVRVNRSRENFYIAWRERGRAFEALHDGQAAPPEKLLQAVWRHQRLQRDQLRTLDGRAIRVFHPGFLSREGGPDFQQAVLQIGDEPPFSGDVEIDLQAGGWQAHGHDRNPRFRNVRLQVVWDEPRRPGSLPAVLCLKPVLDAPLAELARALENETDLPASQRGRCAGALQRLGPPQLDTLLQAAARVRFQNKAEAMLARARTAGWEQTLWENLFRALGYKHNSWPMQNLAELKSQWAPGADSAFAFQVRLFGVSGLLPEEWVRTARGADHFLRRLWDGWWRQRGEFADCILPAAAWRFHSLRPANHPQRRLALAAHWLDSKVLIPGLQRWCVTGVPDRRLTASLRELLQVERDDFWSWHWTFRSARLTRPQPLLGEARVTDLAVNVVLPWLWIRAVEGGNEPIRLEIERRFLAWPAAQDNSLLRLARQRLLGTAGPRSFRTANAQQGLLQIVRDFCDHSNAVCRECQFPELVAEGAW